MYVLEFEIERERLKPLSENVADDENAGENFLPATYYLPAGFEWRNGINLKLILVEFESNMIACVRV